MTDRRAVFGGSFDPVHFGHLMVAELIAEAENLDSITFIPTRRSPHKQDPKASGPHRLAMLRLALRGNRRLQVSPIELQRTGPSYTIDTVRALRSRWRQRPILLLGGDSLLDLASWKEAPALLEETQIIVFARPGAEAAAREARKRDLPYHEVVLSGISSSLIRGFVRRGLSIRYLVPEVVRRYIESHRLYRQPASGRRRS